MSSAAGREERLSFNRRFFMKDGTVGWNPGKLTRTSSAPPGRSTRTCRSFTFETADGGKPLATYVNFAMHLDTVGGLRVSADYPARAGGRPAKVKGPEMVTVFAIGTCGDINHIDVNSPDPQKGPEEAARIGTILAGEVIKTYARMKPVTTGPLRCEREVVKLPLPAVTPGELSGRKTAS